MRHSKYGKHTLDCSSYNYLKCVTECEECEFKSKLDLLYVLNIYQKKLKLASLRYGLIIIQSAHSKRRL